MGEWDEAMGEASRQVKYKHQEKAERIRRESERRKEGRIEDAMSEARETFLYLRECEDPYAMHKAIEGLPIPVLIDILHRRTVHELERESTDE